MIDNDTSIKSPNYLEKMALIRMVKERGMDMLHVTMNDLKSSPEFKDARFIFMGKLVFLVYYRWF